MCLYFKKRQNFISHLKNLFIFGLDLDPDPDPALYTDPHSPKRLPVDLDQHIMNAYPKHSPETYS
jgi:hypothetical protein